MQERKIREGEREALVLEERIKRRKTRTQTQHTPQIPTPIAVIRRAPHRHEQPVEHVFVALLDELVRARDEAQRVDVVELLRDARAEEPARAAWGHSPVFDFVRVRPHQVCRGLLNGAYIQGQQVRTAEGALVWNLLCPG